MLAPLIVARRGSDKFQQIHKSCATATLECPRAKPGASTNPGDLRPTSSCPRTIAGFRRIRGETPVLAAGLGRETDALGGDLDLPSQYKMGKYAGYKDFNESTRRASTSNVCSSPFSPTYYPPPTHPSSEACPDARARFACYETTANTAIGRALLVGGTRSPPA